MPTRAYAAAVSVVSRFGFAVLTGPPEMGKTAAARMIGLAKLADGWELHECIRPEQLWERFAADRPQVFVADDAFGSTEYRPEAAERWALDLDRALRTMDDRHWLLWTSRPAPLKAALRRIHREHGVERFPQPAQVQVDAAALEVEEKALMLFRHAKAARLPELAIAAIRASGWEIVSHPHFTPERIRRFVARGIVDPTAIDAEIREPTTAMAESFHALSPGHRAVLVALLDVPPGPAPMRELAAAARRLAGGAFREQPGAVVDRLSDHFLRVDETGAVGWVHPSWRDLVIEEVAADAGARLDFLRACSLEGILLGLSTRGGTGGRSLPFLVADADWDCTGDRLAELVPALHAPDVTRLLVSLIEAMVVAPTVELDAVAADVLRRLAHRWHEAHAVVPVGQLERWHTLRRLVPGSHEPLDTTATWVELLPAETATVAEVEEWLALVSLLRRHDPDALDRFGFPERQLDALRAFVARVDRLNAVDVLRRLSVVVPELGLVVQVAETEPAETFVPRELSAELQAILDAPSRQRLGTERRLVRRVLSDL
jgi:hypothetical protein